MYLIDFISIFALVLTLNLGLQVLLSGSHDQRQKIFFILCSVIVCWMTTHLVTDRVEDTDIALLSAKIGIIFVSFMPFIFHELLKVLFPTQFNPQRYLKEFSLIVITLIILLSPSRLNIVRIIREPTGVSFEPGILYLLLLIYLMISFGAALKNLWLIIFSKDKELSQQAKLIFSGVFLTVAITITTDIILPTLGYGISSILSPAATIFFTVLTAVAIYGLNLFNLKDVFVQCCMLCISTIFLIKIFYLNDKTQLFLYACLILCLFILGILLVKRTIQCREQETTITKLLDKIKL